MDRGLDAAPPFDVILEEPSLALGAKLVLRFVQGTREGPYRMTFEERRMLE